MNCGICKNLSKPKPIIVAAKVPPNTINIEVNKNSAWNEPPSMKKEPNIENTPINKPINVPNFFIIRNQTPILEMHLIIIYMKLVKDNLAVVNRP